MQIQNGLPDEALDYLSLLIKLYQNYREIRSHEEYITMIGRDKIKDVSNYPQYIMMEAADPLPPGFERRVYHFKDKSHGGGVMDTVFKENALVNIRAQLFLGGYLQKKKLKNTCSIPCYQHLNLYLANHIRAIQIIIISRYQGL
ncbi:MAG: hypothetical protein JXA50_09020 [Deltaproteobacteria bacterium]|nr:hypothetical protein [Deltaproteobacteria bacterium]